MIRRFIIFRFLIGSLITILAVSFTRGQYSMTQYHMYGIPQANHLNPAFQPDCKFYLGMPILSPLRFSLGMSSIQYGDIFSWNSSLGKYINFMHPLGDKDAFLNTLKPVNNLRIALGTDIISMGWKKEKLFVSMDLAERIETNLSLPKDLFQFLVYGSRNQDRFNFSDLGVDLTYFREFALGVSYKTEESIQFGGRVKALFGITNAKIYPSIMNLTTSIENWDIQSQMNIDMSVPFLNVQTDADGKLDTLYLDENFDKEIASNISTMMGKGNLGLGLDLGVSYPVLEKLTVSASLTDLGFIRWKRNIYNLKQDGQFSFDGIEMNLLDRNGGDSNMVNQMMDTLMNQMDFYVSNDPYTTNLSGTLRVGAAYELNPAVRFGLATSTMVYNSRFYNQVTLSANVQPIRAFSASLSYSIIGKNYANLGFGLSLKAGPFNFYFITDQVPSAYLIPKSIQGMNFWLGMNTVFGCSKKKAKKPDDLPLIY
jgi:hypothetical protein